MEDYNLFTFPMSGLGSGTLDYLLDAGQKSILFLDVLRERGNIYMKLDRHGVRNSGRIKAPSADHHLYGARKSGTLRHFRIRRGGQERTPGNHQKY